MIRHGKAPEIITDLSAAEVAKFTGDGKITGDDIIEMHKFLNDFDGDFGRVFQRKEPQK